MTDAELKEDWEDGLSESVIAAKYGLEQAEVTVRRRFLRLRKRPQKWVPTEGEIAAAAARIQEGWSETVRESRRVSPRATWSVPVVSVRDVPGVDGDEIGGVSTGVGITS